MSDARTMGNCPDQVNIRRQLLACGDMAALESPEGVPRVGAWVAELEWCREGHFDDFEDSDRDRIVGDLEHIARVTHRGSPDSLGDASIALGGMLGHFESDMACADILDRALDRIYVTPDHHGALEKLFAGMDIEGKKSDEPAYIALDMVRVTLRYLRLREGTLRHAWTAILGVCYDVLVRVARRNGLDRLAGMMDDTVSREAFCGEQATIADMARLRIAVYDRRNIPTDGEMRGVLARYPKLKSLLGKDAVVRPKGAITQLILHLSLEHLLYTEDYESIYTVVYESNIRLSHWVDRIYRQHGLIYEGLSLGTPAGSALQKRSLEWLHLQVSVRYLVLELWNFATLYRRVSRVTRGLDLDDPDKPWQILDSPKGLGPVIRTMRNRFGAHPDWTFGEAADRINYIGLDSLVYCARATLMFQDAVFRTIPPRYHKVGSLRHNPVPVSLELGTPADSEALQKQYGDASLSVDTGKNLKNYNVLYASYSSLLLLYANFAELASRDDHGDLGAYLRFTKEVYGIKYMILEICNFICTFRKMGIDLPFTPGFLAHEKQYLHIRNNYSAHTRTDKIGDLGQLLGENRGLLSNMAHDIQEIDALAGRLEREFPEMMTKEIRPMNNAEMDHIERDLESLRSESPASCGNIFANMASVGEQREARAKSRRALRP